jgi:hypothetical protein
MDVAISRGLNHYAVMLGLAETLSYQRRSAPRVRTRLELGEPAA